MFGVCLFGLTVIMLSEFLYELADLMIGKRVAFSVVMKIAGYKMPELITQIIPASALFATLLALGRIGRDRELDIMRLSGWSYVRLVTPIIGFAIILSGVAFAISDSVVPAANHAYQNMIRRLIFEDAVPFVEQNVFFRGPENRIFYVRKVNQKTGLLEGVMIYEVYRYNYPRTFTARTGSIQKSRWILDQGVMHEYDDKGFVINEVAFERQVVDTKTDLSGFIGEQKTTNEMTRQELAEQIRLFSRTGFNVDIFRVDYHLKAAAPVASLILTLIGCTFALLASGSGRVLGLAASALFTLVYYVLESVFRTLGTHSVLNPILAAWGANLTFLFLSVAGYLVVLSGWRLNLRRAHK